MHALLLAPFGMFAIVAGLFGIYLATLLRGDGSKDVASETRHNAVVLIIVGTVMLTVAMSHVA